MDETAFSDLVAMIRRSAALTFPPDDAELEELARRAREFGATDEELALSLGALFAISTWPAGTS